jgi:hypothetical protein
MNDNDGPKLMLTLEDGNVISAKKFSWVLSGEVCGCVALLTDGSERLFTEAFPTESQYYGLDESIHALPFEEKRKRVLEATGLDNRDELPWLKYDDAGDPIDEQIEPDLLEAWLFKTVSATDARNEYLGSYTASQYAPGFDLVRHNRFSTFLLP